MVAIWLQRGLLMFAVVLAACGGGGDSPAPAPDPAPPITLQPASQAVPAGVGATFSVAASGANLLYQWQRSLDAAQTWADIVGAVSNVYTITIVDPSMNGQQYRVQVRSGSAVSTSAAVTLSVSPPTPALITQQPSDQAAVAGSNAVFTVAATGFALSYQWQGRHGASAAWADLGGATQATLTLNAVSLADSGRQVRVVISNPAGPVTSGFAVLSVSPAPAAPGFSSAPASVSVQAGQPASFSAIVTGYPTPSLQWQSSTDGGASFADIAGANAATYTIAAAALSANGLQLRLRASNASGTASSTSATLTVTPAPAIVLRKVALSLGVTGCAVRPDNSLACWGDNQNSQIDGASNFFWFGGPYPVPGMGGIEEVSTGPHTCAVRANATLVCWGRNSAGQLGLGAAAISTFFTTPPTTVPGLSGVSAVVISNGFNGPFTCALKADGTVSCFGSNTVGQLGDGTTTDRPSPTPVLGLTDAKALSAGAAHVCALRTNGTVVCWGDNTAGTLGDGTSVRRTTPVPVAGLNSVTAISAGGDSGGHTCALKTDNTVVCWGLSSQGQTGYTTAALTPRVVPQLSDAVAVAASSEHSCAIRAAGTVVCWGGNLNGQLGVGSATQPAFSTTPVAALGMTDVVAITAGYGATCAVRSAGTLFCWGFNRFGQLANGTLDTNRPTPAQVQGITLRLR